YEGAIKTVETMRKIDPTEYRLLFDAGILYARLDKPMAAMRAFENYMELATDPSDIEEARILLEQIRSFLN
ncbi:MAG: tetratricopeptide repeat protein, partial [Pseudomonadota bacterium]